MTPAEIEQAVTRTSAQYMGDLRTMLAEVGKVYEGQLAAKDQTIATQAETIAELRRRAEVAEAALSERSDKPAQAAHAGPGASEVPTEAQGTPPAWGGRLLRAWRGRGA